MSINIDFAYSITAAINKGMLGELAHKQTHTQSHIFFTICCDGITLILTRLSVRQ